MTINFQMPRQGEGWRHYKGGYESLYAIVGVGPDSDGIPTVAYTPFTWGLAQAAPIYFQRLERFLQHIDAPSNVGVGNDHVPRFTYEREPDPSNQSIYIGPRPAVSGDGKIANCIAMLASAVKSGDLWSETLEAAKVDAFAALARR